MPIHKAFRMLEFFGCQPEDVVHHLNLSIATRPGANPNRWDGQFCGDVRCEVAGNEFQNNRECTCLLEVLGGFDYVCPSVTLSLHPKPAKFVNRLRGHA